LAAARNANPEAERRPSRASFAGGRRGSIPRRRSPARDCLSPEGRRDAERELGCYDTSQMEVDVHAVSRLLMLIGALLLLAGLVLRLLGGRLGWLGHLPGDVRIGDSVYIPITSCVVVSLVLTVVLNVLARIFWR
jgi:hypothetical protein